MAEPLLEVKVLVAKEIKEEKVEKPLLFSWETLVSDQPLTPLEHSLKNVEPLRMLELPKMKRVDPKDSPMLNSNPQTLPKKLSS